MQPESRHLNTDIQVLRAAAIGMVLIEHVQINLFYWHSSLQDFLAEYWEGKTGVDLFFVISGFVISRNLLPQLQAAGTGADYLAAACTFLVRRFWRLQPAAWFWVAAPLIVAALFNASGAFHTAKANDSAAFTAVFAINNVYQSLQPFVGAPPTLFFPYWSLSLEEQFYLLLPVIVYLSGRHLERVLVGIVVAQFFMPLVPALIFTRFGALSLGVALSMWRDRPAYGMAEPRFLSRGPLTRAVFLGLMLWLLGTITTDIFSEIQQVKFGLIEVLAGVLVYTASFDRDYIMAPGSLRRLLCWVGSRSYGLYLTHIPAYAMAREIIWHIHRPTFVHDNSEAAAHLLLGLALSGVFAEISYRAIETPCRRFGRTLRVAAPAAFAEALQTDRALPLTVPSPR